MTRTHMAPPSFSIIVFSKDRPLQLHAYLESLFRFSDAKPSDVTVLYTDSVTIPYSKVIHNFTGVHWVREANFDGDLRHAVDVSASCIMFGCDDVIFTAPFSILQSVAVLSENDDIFGVSMRLGPNLAGFPAAARQEGCIYVWDWHGESSHYGYPWELDGTLYRKLDVENMLAQHPDPIPSPNFFESIFAQNAEQYVTRPKLACHERSSLLVLTINRVQETHPNGFDARKRTDPLTLSKVYHEKNVRLDIDAIAGMKANIVHVDSRYFLLKKQSLWQRFKNMVHASPKNISERS